MSRVLWLTKKNFSVVQQSMIKRFADKCGIQSANIFFGNMHQKIPNLWVKKKGTKNKWICNDNCRGDFFKHLNTYINNIKPNIIVVNDEATLGFITIAGYTSLALCRGSVYYYNNIPIIVMDDFSKTRFVKEHSWICTNDLEKLKRWMQDDRRTEPRFKYIVVSSRNELLDLFNIARTSVCISIDIETIAQRISCVGYTLLGSNGTLITYIVPFIYTINENNCYWQNEEDEIYAWNIIKQVHLTDAYKVMQNGGTYDSVFFIEHRIPLNNYLLDTQNMFHSIWCEAPKKLNFIASICLDHCRYWKDELKGSKETNTPKTIEQWQRYWRYNGLDCHNTLLSVKLLIEKYMIQLPWAMNNYAKTFSLQVGPGLEGMCHGMRVHRGRMEHVSEKLMGEHYKALADIRTMCDDEDFNPNSPSQVASLIYDVLGAKPFKSRGKKKYNDRSTDETVLKMILPQHALFEIFIQKIWDVKKPLNNHSKYCKMWLHHGRFKYSLAADGTETGRFASRKFIIVYGNNAQNLPEEMRELMIADPGHVFVEFDYSNADGHFIAFESQDANMIRNVLDERDTHCVHAEFFFKIPYDEVYKGYKKKEHWVVHSTEGVRQNTKRLGHGANYRMAGHTCYMRMTHAAAVKTLQARGFKNAHTWPMKQIVKEIQILLDSYSTELYPTLSIWFDTIVDEAIENGNLVTCALGRTRLFFGNIRKEHSIQREISAQYGQGGTAGIINRSLLDYYYSSHDDLKDVRFITQTHDSALFQIPEKRLELIENILTIMEKPVTIKGREFIVPAAAKIGRTWGPEVHTMLPYYKEISLAEIDAKEVEVNARYTDEI